MYLKIYIYISSNSNLSHISNSRSPTVFPQLFETPSVFSVRGAGLSGRLRPELLPLRHGGLPTPQRRDDRVVPGSPQQPLANHAVGYRYGHGSETIETMGGSPS